MTAWAMSGFQSFVEPDVEGVGEVRPPEGDDCWPVLDASAPLGQIHTYWPKACELRSRHVGVAAVLYNSISANNVGR